MSESGAMLSKRLKGMKIRQEFICPITHDLLRDPVVLADGHTYERSAIENWIKRNPPESRYIVSPMNGSKIEQTILSNLTLKKLIQDLINEGGAGLYTKDTSDGERMFEVRPERILVMTCYGPPESEWFEKKFHVTSLGCIGGRNVHDESLLGRDVMSFKETTVSRRHFEVSKESETFSIRDLGSAGGTFVRIFHGQRKVLNSGMIFLVGKHQFLVCSIDESQRDNDLDEDSTLASFDDKDDHQELEDLITDAEQLLVALDSLRTKTLLGGIDSNELETEAVQRKLELEAQVADIHERMSRLKKGKSTSGSGAERAVAAPKPLVAVVGEVFRSKRCTLTCIAPDHSPLQGRTILVSSTGAIIGRNPGCTICMCDEIEGKMVAVDKAISTEHARIEYDTESGNFFLLDGSLAKPSTNGTWCRLSGPYQESPYHELSSGIEILIGTTRFSIGESMTISEHDSVFSQTQQQKTSGSAEGKDNLHSQGIQDKKMGNKFDEY